MTKDEKLSRIADMISDTSRMLEINKSDLDKIISGVYDFFLLSQKNMEEKIEMRTRLLERLRAYYMNTLLA